MGVDESKDIFSMKDQEKNDYNDATHEEISRNQYQFSDFLHGFIQNIRKHGEQ
jgi:hypothetical protein